MKNTVFQRPTAPGWALASFEGEGYKNDPLYRHLPAPAKRLVQSLVKKRKVTGRFGEATTIFLAGKRPEAVILLGLGKNKEFHRRRMLVLMQQLMKTAKDQQLTGLSVAPERMHAGPWEKEEHIEAQAVAAHLARYAFVKYKSSAKKARGGMEKLEFVVGAKDRALARRAVFDAARVADAVNAARDLANTPGSDMTPKSFMQSARSMLKGLPIKMTVLGEKAMEKKGMGGVLGVGRGSKEEAQFAILEYLPNGKRERPIVFVGKGVTFDSGGLNLKPENAINDMHHDMAGAGAVLSAAAAIARLKTKRNVVCLLPLVENMPGGAGYRPGDLLKTYSGKTIEVANTDAEGRVILADALALAKEYKPLLVVDVATLTGAAIVALGKRLAAALSPNEALAFALRTFSEKSGDYVWPLPLWEEFREEITGTFGDVVNIGKIRGAGGVITAAMFLKEFTDGYEWVHLDIASTMLTTEGQYLAPGASGAGVRLLIDVARRFDDLRPYLKA
jgi:leucyl aminopeptidase